MDGGKTRLLWMDSRIDLQTNSNTYKTTHTIYLLLAEPRRKRFTSLPPGEDFDFDSPLNRFGILKTAYPSFHKRISAIRPCVFKENGDKRTTREGVC